MMLLIDSVCACEGRTWPLLVGVKFGRCGYCGEVPVAYGPTYQIEEPK